MYNYLNVQEVKINAIFNEYGLEFSQYATYEGSNEELKKVYARLCSRYSYLHRILLNDIEALIGNLDLLE
jgi:hypothetical protein